MPRYVEFRALPLHPHSTGFIQDEKMRKLLRVRLDMAKFLQETLRESGLKANAHIVGTDAFKEFFRKVRVPAPTSYHAENSAPLTPHHRCARRASRPPPRTSSTSPSSSTTT